MIVSLRGLKVELTPLEGKRPLNKSWQTEKNQQIEIEGATGVGIVLGKMSSGVVDIDVDDERVCEFLSMPKTLTWSRNGRITHYLYRCPDRWDSKRFLIQKKCIIEIRGDGSQTMIPPSMHPCGERLAWDSKTQEITSITYDNLLSIVDNAMQNLMNKLGIKQERKEYTNGVSKDVDVLERARNYVAKMNPAISGCGGHAATYRVALTLIKGFDIPYHQAWPIFAWYNANRCHPPWTVKELRHKMDEAIKSGIEPGYLNKRRTK